MSTGMRGRNEAVLERSRAIERDRRLEIRTVWLWKNGPVSADSTTGGLLNSSISKCPNGGGRSSVLPNEPNTVGICPKPPSRGRPSVSASGISFAFVGLAMLNPRGLPSTRGNPGVAGLNDIPAVPPPLK